MTASEDINADAGPSQAHLQYLQMLTLDENATSDDPTAEPIASQTRQSLIVVPRDFEGRTVHPVEDTFMHDNIHPPMDIFTPSSTPVNTPLGLPGIQPRAPLQPSLYTSSPGILNQWAPMVPNWSATWFNDERGGQSGATHTTNVFGGVEIDILHTTGAHGWGEGPSVAPFTQPGEVFGQEYRQRSSESLRHGACWRCAQRAPCDEGSPCEQCLQTSAREQILSSLGDCSNISEYVHEFLPPSMTVMHQRQTILDTVHDQVIEWDTRRPIEVHLTCGYGRPLLWTLHEFRPRTNDLLGQYQYIHNNKNGQSERIHKYSPPFGVMKLDGSDEQRVQTYLQGLLEREHLQHLGWTFYEEERVADPQEFQAVLLTLLCTLYMSSNPRSTVIQDPKVSLQDILHKIIRMIVVTYVMGHTLTIPDPYLQDVIDHVQFTPSKPWCSHTSPRLANRQLKFYFGVLRCRMYDEILMSLQKVLRCSILTEENWLCAFCAILGLAMGLEEVQRAIWIQADAKIVKNEAPYHSAIMEARNACQRIDDRFDLLIKVFHLKYRHRNWGENGSFGVSTPQFEATEQREFCRGVWSVLNEDRDHLESRRNVEGSRQTMDVITSRLVSRFLLPFLELPGNEGRG